MQPQGNYVRKNIESVEKALAPFGATLLPVTKTFGVEAIALAYQAGYRHFGENRVQELVPKYEALPKDIQWHLIGHLQTNKVKYIAPFISLIHSVDSERLLEEIDRQAARAGRTIPVLLQVYIATEESKFGWDAREVKEWVAAGHFTRFTNIRVEGLMGMASNTDNESLVRSEFKALHTLFEELKNYAAPALFEMKTLSMGMSSDYLLACEEGSTLVRMGSAIFGKRA